MRRTSHPSGSRPPDVAPLRQTSAPGIVDAPENPRFPAVSNRVQDLASSVAEGGLQEYKQGNQADRRTPELCCPSVECQRRSRRAWLPIATSFAETRGLPTSAVISLDSF